MDFLCWRVGGAWVLWTLPVSFYLPFCCLVALGVLEKNSFEDINLDDLYATFQLWDTILT